MKTRRATWSAIRSKLDLFNDDDERIFYLYRQISDNNIDQSQEYNYDYMLQCFNCMKTTDAKLFFAKMVRQYILSNSDCASVLEKIGKKDRATFDYEQEKFWKNGRSTVEEEEIRAKIQMIQYPDSQVQRIPAHEVKIENKNTFKERLAAIKYIGEIPEYMTCPITGDIMVDPISMSSGVFYDRAAIVAWFKTKEPLEQIPCPKTNLPIDRHELAVHTNVVMRYLIDDFVKSKEDVARQFNASVSPIPSSNHARFFANADDQASSHARFFADADDQNLSRDAGDSGNYKTSSSPLWQK